jgi:hypothetical protein
VVKRLLDAADEHYRPSPTWASRVCRRTVGAAIRAARLIYCGHRARDPASTGATASIQRAHTSALRKLYLFLVARFGVARDRRRRRHRPRRSEIRFLLDSVSGASRSPVNRQARVVIAPRRATSSARCGGDELLDRLDRLDACRHGRRLRPPGTPDGARAAHLCDWDVVIAGGGLSLLLAPLLAARGLPASLCSTRGHIGAVHREWNCSGEELAPLWETGLLDRDDGRIPGAQPLPARFLPMARGGHVSGHGRAGPRRRRGGPARHGAGARDLDRGETLFDRHRGHGRMPPGLRTPCGFEEPTPTVASFAGTTRVFVDARGSASPRARGDLTCPTVGGVFTGLDEGVDDPRAHRPRRRRDPGDHRGGGRRPPAHLGGLPRPTRRDDGLSVRLRADGQRVAARAI